MVDTRLLKNRPREAVQVLCDYELSAAPGKSIVVVEVDYPPQGYTPPHRHNGATVVAVVTQGNIVSGMNGEEPKLYTAHQSFVEQPGCHHTHGENPSTIAHAKMIVTFIVDTEIVNKGYENLTVLDSEWQ